MKKLISLLLVLVMAFPMQGYASEKVEVKANNSYLKDADYTISSPQELVDFNWGDVKASEKVVLTNDINMKNYKYKKSYAYLKGTLDGQGYSISNLDGGESSLLHAIDTGGMVKNLVIRDSSFKNGPLVGYYNYGMVDNCHVIDTVITGSMSGSLVESNGSGATVVNCSVQGIVSSENVGLVEYNATDGEVCNSYCFNGKLINRNYGDTFSSYSVEELRETTDMDELLAELNSNQRNGWLEWEIRPQESPYPQLVKMVHLDQCSVTVSPDSFVYDGTEKYPDIKVAYGDKELVRNKDYEVRYSDYINAGTAKLKIGGLRQYVGCVSQLFVIDKANLTGAKVIITPAVYDGTPKVPKLSVSCNGRGLTSGKDYTVSYSNNTNAGTVKVTVTGKGNYEGTAEADFEIQKADIAKAGVFLEKQNYDYDGKAKEPNVTVKVGNKILSSDTDYSVTYSNNTNAGTAKVKVTGIGNYTGSKEVSFSIAEKPKLTCKKTLYKVAYGAKPFKINALSNHGMTFTSSKPEIAAVDKNTGKVTIKNTGVAVVTIQAGNLNKKVTIEVSPKKPSVKSAKAAKGRKLTAKWAKDKTASGYQVQISTDKKFKKNVKSKSLPKTSYTFIKLKTGKKYYVRIRSYKKSGKETLYSAWSKTKASGKIKK